VRTRPRTLHTPSPVPAPLSVVAMKTLAPELVGAVTRSDIEMVGIRHTHARATDPSQPAGEVDLLRGWGSGEPTSKALRLDTCVSTSL
jgi:hypothetical protein